MEDHNFKDGYKKLSNNSQILLDLPPKVEEVRKPSIKEQHFEELKEIIEKAFSCEGYSLESTMRYTWLVTVKGTAILKIEIHTDTRSATFRSLQDLKKHNLSLLKNTEFRIRYKHSQQNEDIQYETSLLGRYDDLLRDMVVNRDATFEQAFGSPDIRLGDIKKSMLNNENIYFIGSDKGELIIKGINNLKYFLGGFCAITEPELDLSTRNNSTEESKKKYTRIRNGIIIFLFIVFIFQFF